VIFAAGVDPTTLAVDGDAVARLLMAGVLGAAVGLEREAGDQPAGLRTHIAVALGAALFGVVSTLGFLEFQVPRAESNVNIDVARVASNVAVGIGFLGAGVIFRSGGSIRNLTTAASLWTVAAIGLACGVGDLGTAAVATFVLLASLVLLRPLRDWVRHRFAKTSMPVRIQLVAGTDPDRFLDELHAQTELEADDVFLEKKNGRMIVVLTLNAHPQMVRRWMSHVAATPEVEGLVQA
jgi:putative Mg2+ transporter-C (MgtC) family protein